MPEIEIRCATVNDAAAIANVRRQGWQETYRGFLSDSYLDQMSVQQATELWKKIIPTHTGFVAVMQNEANEIIGFVSGGKNRAKEFNCEGEIYALYLLKKYHGLGLGKQLFVQGVSRLSQLGHKSFCVFVLKDNPTLLFYEKFSPDLKNCVKVKLGEFEYDEMGLGWSDINKFRA